MFSIGLGMGILVSCMVILLMSWYINNSVILFRNCIERVLVVSWICFLSIVSFDKCEYLMEVE